MNIVLHQPEIPDNTGNIGRTCVATGTVLHLIDPLGFRLTSNKLRRAGMDYWDKLDVRRYMNFEEFVEKNLKDNPTARIWLASTKAKKVYSEVSYGKDDFLMFGKESAGIPEEILVRYEESCVRIPMLSGIRSLNLANSVSIVLFEALRQNEFCGLEREGELHHLAW
jgi:tRNA (cytidine/uridine-2'-O-)-methyltransferase